MSKKATRLTASRITYATGRDGKPVGKKLRRLPDFDKAFTSLTETQQRDLGTILSAIRNGQVIEDRFYRRGIGTTSDELLRKEGIKHLHLGGQGSNCILYLIEYEEEVVLVEISDHRYLDSKPVGKGLPHAGIQAEEKAIRSAAEQEEAKRAEDDAKLAAAKEKLLSGKRRKPDTIE